MNHSFAFGHQVWIFHPDIYNEKKRKDLWEKNVKKKQTTVFKHKKWGHWDRALWYFRGCTPTINQTLQPETHFGFKQVFASYDWASERVCVTVQHGANEIPNRHQAMLELEPFTPSYPSSSSSLVPLNSPNPSTSFIKTWTWGRIEKWAELKLDSRLTQSRALWYQREMTYETQACL